MADGSTPGAAPRPTEKALVTTARPSRKVRHYPVTERVLRAIEKSYKANEVVLRLAEQLRQEWSKQPVAVQDPLPVVDLRWDSGRPKVLGILNSDGFLELYARDVDLYVVELQPWETADEEVAKLARAYRDLYWPVLLRETGMVKWLARPASGVSGLSADEFERLLWKVNMVVKDMLLEEVKNG